MKKKSQILIHIALAAKIVTLFVIFLVFILQTPICNLLLKESSHEFVFPIPDMLSQLAYFAVFLVSYILILLGGKKENKIAFEVIALVVFIVGTNILSILDGIILNSYSRYMLIRDGMTTYTSYSYLKMIIGSVQAYNPLNLCTYFIIIAPALMIGNKKKTN